VGDGRRGCADRWPVRSIYRCVLRPRLIVRSLTLLAGRLTKEDTDIVDTRIATGTMKAFVEEVEGFDVVKG
jgi:hypothetical protein